MSREILFKAKRKNWRELPKEKWWVEGYYVESKGHHYILPAHDSGSSFIEIGPETICQYTGLTDKNGKKIFEGNICVIHDGFCDDDGGFIVEYDTDNGRYFLNGNKVSTDFSAVYGYECEIVSNVLEGDTR